MAKPNSCAFNNFLMVWNILIIFRRGIDKDPRRATCNKDNFCYGCFLVTPFEWISKAKKKKKKKNCVSGRLTVPNILPPIPILFSGLQKSFSEFSINFGNFG